MKVIKNNGIDIVILVTEEEFEVIKKESSLPKSSQEKETILFRIHLISNEI